MDDVINAVKSSALNVAELFTPILKESKFKESGVLTPEEFVIAGDHLVQDCPTWQWISGDESKSKPYLPKDKQMLITRNVPCYRRFRQIDNLISHEKLIDGDDIDHGWVDTHFYAPENALEKIKDMKLDGAAEGCSKTSAQSGTKEDSGDEADEPADMEAFMEHGIVDDDPNAAVMPCNKPNSEPSSDQNRDGIVRTRTYDLNITYDRYYRTPRMWLCGYDENGKPLSVDQMYEDFSADHTKKTVTMETHPHLTGPPMASIHPCRHADVMKRIIEQLAENGKDLDVQQYLIILLKFLQAVIPTIEYDYTRHVKM